MGILHLIKSIVSYCFVKVHLEILRPLIILSPMELGSIMHFLQDKTILVTGATGFLAKSLSLSFYLSKLAYCACMILSYISCYHAFPCVFLQFLWKKYWEFNQMWRNFTFFWEPEILNLLLNVYILRWMYKDLQLLIFFSVIKNLEYIIYQNLSLPNLAIRKVTNRRHKISNVFRMMTDIHFALLCINHCINNY